MTVLAQVRELLDNVSSDTVYTLLIAHRVGLRQYVSVWAFREGEIRWHLHQDGRFIASGCSTSVRPEDVERLILHDAGILRVAWSWLTDRGKRLGPLGAVRTVRVLEHRSDSPRHVYEMLSTPEPGFAWLLRDTGGSVLSCGNESAQRAARIAAYAAAGVTL